LKIDLKDYLATEGKKYRKRHELLLLCIKSGMIYFFEPYAFNKTNPNEEKLSFKITRLENVLKISLKHHLQQ
jgi:hypothetical protein